MITSNTRTAWLWNISLGCFIVAALTGFLYRLGMIGWLPAWLGLALDNIRHAHSHLMFFGWAVPFPLIILANYLVSKCGNKRPGQAMMHYSIMGALLFGILSYPFFLWYGYRPVNIGSALLPLSVIFSGLVMICWYGFAWGYLQLRKLLDGDASQPWFDGALVMLVVASLGAWGVAVAQALAAESHLLSKSLTHFFLATFTEGWVVLIVLAILVAKLQPAAGGWKISSTIWLGSIAIGAPLTFPYGISESLLSPMLLTVARLGGGLAAIGLLGMIYKFVAAGKGKHKIWGWILGLLALKGVMQLVASVSLSTFWLSDHSLRLFYLHVLLLGALTLAMTAWLQQNSTIPLIYFYSVIVAILAVLGSLILPTAFWPQMWGGVWIFYALVFAALLPPLAMGAQWNAITSSQKKIP